MTSRHPSAALVALVALLAASASAQPGTWLETFAVPGAYRDVAALAAGADGLVVGGRFNTVDGLDVENVARWDGAAWDALGGGVRLSGGFASVRGVLVQSDGAVVVAGLFDRAGTGAGEVETGGIARYADGAWTSLGRLVISTGTGDELSTGAALIEIDGVLYVGGAFGAVVGPDGERVAASGIAAWDGERWAALGGGASYVTSLTALGGDLVAGGSGSFFDGTGTPVEGTQSLARWDGTAWHPFGGGVSGGSPSFGAGLVSSMTEFDGDLVVATSARVAVSADGTEVPLSGVARWDGRAWHAVGGFVTAVAQAVTVFDGDLYAGGDLRVTYGPPGEGGIRVDGLARWTGTVWEPVAGSPRRVEVLVPFGEHLAAGVGFGTPVLSGPDGTFRASGVAAVTPGVGWRPLSARYTGRQSIQSPPEAVAPDPCGGLMAAGDFSRAGQAPAAGLAAWDGAGWRAPWGGIDLGFGFFFDATYSVSSVAFEGACSEASPLVAGGFFYAVVGPDGAETEARHVARWDGTSWHSLGGGTDSVVEAVVQTDGNVYVGGGFAQVFDADGTAVDAPAVARWDGAAWHALDGGLRVSTEYNSDATPYVHRMMEAPSGGVVVAGQFETVVGADGSGQEASGLASWSPGGGWDVFGQPFRNRFTDRRQIYALALDGDAVVIGGSFDGVRQRDGSEVAARSVARWDGTAWTAFGDGLPGLVTALAVGADNRLYAGVVEYVPNSNVITGNRIYVWTGAAWEVAGEVVGERVVSLAAMPDGRLYAAGAFALVGGVVSPGLAVLETGVATSASERPRRGLGVRAFPNPTRGRATLDLTVAEAGLVRAVVYDALGREVARLWDGPAPAGPLALSLDAQRLPAGVYVVRVEAGAEATAQTITVVR